MTDNITPTHVSVLRDRIARHRTGESVGVTIMCSAHPLVIAAAAPQAKADEDLLPVEVTSNQLDHFGVYTGLLSSDFAALVHQRPFNNLDSVGVPLPMLSQHLPLRDRRVRVAELCNRARTLTIDHVRDVLRDYACACGEEGASA